MALNWYVCVFVCHGDFMASNCGHELLKYNNYTWEGMNIMANKNTTNIHLSECVIKLLYMESMGTICINRAQFSTKDL